MNSESDTTADAAHIRLAVIRSRPPELRLRDALELSEVVQRAAMARLRVRYPESSTADLVRRLHGMLPDGHHAGA